MRRASPLILLCLAGCAALRPEPHAPQAGMANPASVYCQQQGGTLRIEKDLAGGEQGVCHLPHGEACEEWALFGHACPAGLAPQGQPGPTVRAEGAPSAR